MCRDQDDRQGTPSIAEEQLICKSSLMCLFALVRSVRVWAEVDSLTRGLSSWARLEPKRNPRVPTGIGRGLRP